MIEAQIHRLQQPAILAGKSLAVVADRHESETSDKRSGVVFILGLGGKTISTCSTIHQAAGLPASSRNSLFCYFFRSTGIVPGKAGNVSGDSLVNCTLVN